MNPLADSPDVTRRIKELRYEAVRRGQQCGVQAGTGSAECWCVGRGLNGCTLPCPEAGKDLPATTVEIPL